AEGMRHAGDRWPPRCTQGWFLPRHHAFRPGDAADEHLPRRDLRPGARGAARRYARRSDRAREPEPVCERHRDLHRVGRRRTPLRGGDPGRHGGRQRADSRAGRLFLLRRLEELALWRPAGAWHGVGEVLYAHQGRDLTLAAPGHARPRISYADTRMKPYCAVAAAALAFSAWAQAPSPDQYPAKPIRLIVPLT